MAICKISIDVDPQTLEFSNNQLKLKLASRTDVADNGLSFNVNGRLIATRGTVGLTGTGQYQNTAYNCIDNENSNDPETTIAIVRCNSTVTRKKLGDPDSSNEGICLKTELGL